MGHNLDRQHDLWSFSPILRSTLFLAPREFYLTELGYDSSAPGGFCDRFWSTRFPFARWLPTQGKLRDTSLINSQYAAQPSDSSASDFHDNALATSFSVKVRIRDLDWPEDGYIQY